MSSSHKIVVFDIDNTLTESRSPMSHSLSKVLSDLIDRVPVAIISGGSFKDFDYQIISCLQHRKKENLFILPTEGAEFRIFKNGVWHKVYSNSIDDRKRHRIFKELAKEAGISPVKLCGLVEDRGGVIGYHPLGTHASLEEKYAWDPTREKRLAIIKKLEPRLPGVFMAAAGSATINFSEEGVNKAFGVRKLMEYMHIAPTDVLFIGDALSDGGNDAPVKTLNVDTRGTSGPKETEKIVSQLVEEINKDREKKVKTVAFFCSEYGVEETAPLYAGGLGILAGDMVHAAGLRTDIKFIGFGLISHKGMKTVGKPDGEDYTDKLVAAGFKKVLVGRKVLVVSVPLGDRDIAVCVWKKEYGNATLFFLDTDVSKNNEKDRHITDYLYDTERGVKIIQELVLGVGSLRVISGLKITPDVFHFNEGHAALCSLATVLETQASDKKGLHFSEMVQNIRNSFVATKHTILPGAGLYLTTAEFSQYIEPYIKTFGVDPMEVHEIGALDRDKDAFSTIKFLLSVSERSNGVSVSHVIAEKKQYPQSVLVPVTNGVDVNGWQGERIKDSAAWRIEDHALFQAKKIYRKELVEFVNKETGAKLSPDCLTIVWARRFATYKRPGLLFNNEQKLLDLITDSQNPVQIVVAGKVHPLDVEGMRALSLVKKVAENPRFKGRVVYVNGYSIHVARILVKGADVWLNTPIPGFEACGTSGMKAGLNGAFMMSTDDGWVAEVPLLKKIGCIIPETNIENKLYDLIREKVVKEFYAGPVPGKSPQWLSRMRQTIFLVEKDFNVSRMMDDYVRKLYNHYS